MNNAALIAELKQRAAVQEAWGKWNTAPLRNEIARLEDAARSPLHRAARRAAGAVIVAASVAVWAYSIAAPVINLFVGG